MNCKYGGGWDFALSDLTDSLFLVVNFYLEMSAFSDVARKRLYFPYIRCKIFVSDYVL